MIHASAHHLPTRVCPRSASSASSTTPPLVDTASENAAPSYMWDRRSTPFVLVFYRGGYSERSLPTRSHFATVARKIWPAARSQGLSGQAVVLRAS